MTSDNKTWLQRLRKRRSAARFRARHQGHRRILAELLEPRLQLASDIPREPATMNEANPVGPISDVSPPQLTTDLSPTANPSVESILINGGDSQRSTLESLSITFDREVVIDASGFPPIQLIDRNTRQVVTSSFTQENSLGKSAITLNFQPGSFVQDRVDSASSLVEGSYQLTISSLLVTANGFALDGDLTKPDAQDFVIGDQSQDHLCRLYGDGNGDGDTDFTDFASYFLPSFGTAVGDAANRPFMDHDGDADVDFTDFANGFLPNFGGTCWKAITNDPPLSMTDQYTTVRGAQLSVTTQGGLLGNDMDADTSDSLAVVAYTQPNFGTLQNVNPDGSFEYVTDPNYVGPVTFDYSVSDGLTRSTEQVTILIEDVLPTVSVFANQSAGTGNADLTEFTVVMTAASSTETVIHYIVSGNATPNDGMGPASGFVTIPAGETMAPIDFVLVDDCLGPGHTDLMVALTSISGDAVIATDGSQTAMLTLDIRETTRILDNSDIEFLTNGGFSVIEQGAGYQGSINSALGSSGTATAYWNVGVSPGRHRISTTWPINLATSTATPVKIYDGSTGAELYSTTIDQTQPPIDRYDRGLWWADVDERNISGNTLIIEIGNSDPSGFAIADAIRVERIASGSATPTTSDLTVSMFEDTFTNFLTPQGAFVFDFDDVDTTDELHGIEIIEVPTLGELTLGTRTVLAGQFVSRRQLLDGMLRYTPETDEYGTNYANFTFRVSDGASFSNLGTATIDVTAVNDIPTSNATTRVIDPSDNWYQFKRDDFTYQDIEGDAFAGIRLERVPDHGTLWIFPLEDDGYELAKGASISTYSIENDQFWFQTDDDASGISYATLEFRVEDGQDRSFVHEFAFDVVDSNGAPTTTDTDVLVANDLDEFTFKISDFPFADSLDSLDSIRVMDWPDATAGTLVVGGQPVTAGSQVSAADIAAGNFRLQKPIVVPDMFRFDFSVSDGSSESDVRTMNATYSDLNTDSTITVRGDRLGSIDGVTIEEALAIARDLGPERNTIAIEVTDGSPILIRDSLIIDSDVEIVGVEFNYRIQPETEFDDLSFGMIEVASGVRATLTNLQITGGILEQASGAGILNQGDLELHEVIVENNWSLQAGGGITNMPGAFLKLVGSTVTGNTSGLSGAGIDNHGELQVTASTIDNNIAVGDGGGIYNAANATAAIANATLSDNEGRIGGGVFNLGELDVASSTVSHNRSLDYGGGISNVGLTTIGNTIVAENVGFSDTSGTFASDGNNLVGRREVSSGFDSQIGDLIHLECHALAPRLGPLQLNGGLTKTRALLAGSPAIDAGSAITSLEFDQRGANRVLDGPEPWAPDDITRIRDIGAFEMGTFFVNVSEDAIDDSVHGDGKVDVDPIIEGDQVSFRAAIQELNALAGYNNGNYITSGKFDAVVQFSKSHVILDIQGAEEDDATTGDVDIYGNLSILSTNENQITIDGGWETYDPDLDEEPPVSALRDRLLHVHPGHRLRTDGVILTGGWAVIVPVNPMVPDGPKKPFSGHGGAIFNEEATLETRRTELSRNLADDTGGAIFTFNGTTTIDSQTLVDLNIAYLGGGLASVDSDTSVLGQSKITYNEMGLAGGALYVKGGALEIGEQSQVFENGQTTEDSGWSFNPLPAPVTPHDSTNYHGSEIYLTGAAGLIHEGSLVRGPIYGASPPIYPVEGWKGGLIFNDDDLTILDSTLSDNIQAFYGGAVYNVGNLHVERTTFSNISSNAGGIFNDSHAKAYILDSLFENTSTFHSFDGGESLGGGAILNNNGSVDFISSEIRGSQGGVDYAGAIWNYDLDAVFNLVDSQVIGSSSGHPSAVVSNDYGTLNVLNSSFIGNKGDAAQGEFYVAPALKNSTHHRALSTWDVIPVELSADMLTTDQTTFEINLPLEIDQARLPAPLYIGGEEMVLVASNANDMTMTVERIVGETHLAHNQGAAVEFDFDMTNKIAVEDIEPFTRYNLPLTVAVWPGQQQSPDRNLWLTTSSDVSQSGIPGLGNWDNSEILQLQVPDSVYENRLGPRLTSSFDFGELIPSGVTLDGIDRVSKDVTLAGTFLYAGDVLLSTAGDLSIGTETYQENDLILFRPKHHGDYSEGTFSLLIDALVPGNLKDIAGYYDATGVSDDRFALYLTQDEADNSDSVENVYRYRDGETMEVWLDGDDLGLSDVAIDGIEYVEFESEFSNHVSGDRRLLLSLSSPATIVGASPLPVTEYDIFELKILASELDSQSSVSVGEATMYLPGVQMGLDSPEEQVTAIALRVTPSGFDQYNPEYMVVTDIDVPNRTLTVNRDIRSQGDLDLYQFDFSIPSGDPSMIVNPEIAQSRPNFSITGAPGGLTISTSTFSYNENFLGDVAESPVYPGAVLNISSATRWPVDF